MFGKWFVFGFVLLTLFAPSALQGATVPPKNLELPNKVKSTLAPFGALLPSLKNHYQTPEVPIGLRSVHAIWREGGQRQVEFFDSSLGRQRAVIQKDCAFTPPRFMIAVVYFVNGSRERHLRAYCPAETELQAASY